jgi:cytochrome c-type biogenesis protein CcmH
VKRLAGLVAVLLLALGPAVALAADPDEMLKDPKLEARAEAIGNNLRCLVCQNESIEASGADLAHQLRVLVRQRLEEGDTDQQVVDYLVSRYGEFVLLKPVFAWHTLALWGAAPAVIIIGAVTLIILARRRRPAPTTELTAEEAEALAKLRDAEAPAE